MTEAFKLGANGSIHLTRHIGGRLTLAPKRLIILSASQRRSSDAQPLPAIDRYQGVFFRVVKKYLREGRLGNTDIVIVSEKYGVLKAHDKIPYDTPFQGGIPLSKQALKQAYQKNVVELRSLLAETKYSEILVVSGLKFRKLIEGFEELTDAKVVVCEGTSLGRKAQNLRRWILAPSMS